ncbi:MAG: cytidylate kinase family protein [Candidatus Aenigmatarchaeota archaeon]
MVVIAVSGLPGSGSSTLSKLLAEKLNLKYFSPGEYFKNQSDKNNQTSKALDVFKIGKGKEKKFHESIDEMQKKFAREGNIVICGKLSILMLKDIADYKIWLDCSIEERARRTAKRDSISYEEALKAIKEREILEVEEWEKDYGIDYRKQREMADIIIDTSKMSEKEVLEKVLNFIKF